MKTFKSKSSECALEIIMICLNNNLSFECTSDKTVFIYLYDDQQLPKEIINKLELY